MELKTSTGGVTKVEYLQAKGFVRNFNPPLTGLDSLILVYISTSPSLDYIVNPSL
jgi:hypothetical protein